MNNNSLIILLAAPRGFCAGVERAIEIVKKSLIKYGSPIYVRHEIVHNKYVVDNLKKMGAIFIEELNEIKDQNRPVIFSAHGVPKSVPKDANLKKIEYIDATCPLVSKVHREAEYLYSNNFHILLIGHQNHPEVIGTMGQLPKKSIDLIETIDDAKNYNNSSNKKLSYITQTTLSVDDTLDIVKILKKKFPSIKEPKKDDICYATTNRQEAVKKIAHKCDLFIVIGAKNSSNSLRLKEVAKQYGTKKSILVENIENFDMKNLIKTKNVGITASASAPEIIVQNFIKLLKKNYNVILKQENYIKENVFFKIPEQLKIAK